MRIFLLAAALLLPGIAYANGLQRHETMSGAPMPYDFNSRNAATSLALQEKRRNGCGCGSGGGAGQINNSYAIGNWTQINMTLGSNANAMLNNEEHQNNWGNETATMNIDSQNALGDQTVNNGGEWSGSIQDQNVGNNNN